jgi:hypothetical protein
MSPTSAARSEKKRLRNRMSQCLHRMSQCFHGRGIRQGDLHHIRPLILRSLLDHPADPAVQGKSYCQHPRGNLSRRRQRTQR